MILSTAAGWHVRRVRKGEREQALETLITKPVAAYKLRRLSVLDSSREVHGLSPVRHPQRVLRRPYRLRI